MMVHKKKNTPPYAKVQVYSQGNRDVSNLENGIFRRGMFQWISAEPLCLWMLKDTAGGLFILSAVSDRSRLSIAGRSCLMQSHLSRPDISYFTHDGRNVGIIPNTFLSSSLCRVINWCDFSLLLIRPMRTVFWVHSWKDSPSSSTPTWV